MSSDSETVVVRCLTGAEATYSINPIENADAMFLEAYMCDAIAAEAQVGDALLVEIHGHHNDFHVARGNVAATGTTNPVRGRGIAIPVTTAFATNELQQPIVVCKNLPRHNFHQFKIRIKNAHTDADLTVANSGATRALLTMRLRVTFRDPVPHPGGGLHPSLIARGRFNEYVQ